MRRMSLLASSLALLAAALPAQQPPPPPNAAAPAKAATQIPAAKKDTATLLPDSFSGWIATDAPQAISDPAQADPANAGPLKEYDFTDAMLGDYKRGKETLTLHALRFRDASGAYGAYSFYRQNGWPKEDVGTGAASNHNRVLFWLGNVLVDANFSHIGPMTGSELRDLAARLPIPGGNRDIAPPILGDLPTPQLNPQSTHYALGPAGYAGSGGVLPPDLVGFDRGAEAVTASYTLRSNPATLTIINYPTPQMAAAQEAKIRAYIKAGNPAANPAQPAWPKPLQDSDAASLEVRRSGPLVALVSGDAIPDESHKLLAAVHFEADLTTIPAPPGESDVSKTAKLLMGIVVLVVVGAAAALLLGFFLGGGRALYRVARGKPASSVYEEEFIHLDLREEWVESAPAVDTAHPKG
jgi:hypothetical protein